MGGCGILYDLPWFQFKYKNSAIVVLTHTDINAWWEFIRISKWNITSKREINFWSDKIKKSWRYLSALHLIANNNTIT